MTAQCTPAGVKVWLKYHESAIPQNYFTRTTGFAMPLSKVRGLWELCGPSGVVQVLYHLVFEAPAAVMASPGAGPG